MGTLLIIHFITMHTKKYTLPIVIAALAMPVVLAVMYLFFSPMVAHANPFYIGSGARTATATSTQALLRPGVATSTLPIYDSYESGGTNQTNSGNITVPNTVAILLDGNASSTAAVISGTCEYSDNYNPSTGTGDWYQNEITTFGTTTGIANLATVNGFSFIFASSTVGGGAVGALSSRFQKLVTCPVPLRYVRLVVSVAGANASIWAAIIPTKQRNSGN